VNTRDVSRIRSGSSTCDARLVEPDPRLPDKRRFVKQAFASRHQPGLTGEHDELGSIPRAELDHGPADVGLGRGRDDEHAISQEPLAGVSRPCSVLVSGVWRVCAASRMTTGYIVISIAGEPGPLPGHLGLASAAP
jgi:hypothetical protein